MGTIYLATLWFSEKMFSLIAGITLMSANFVSASLISMLVLFGKAEMHFRVAMGALALVALILAFLLFAIVQKPTHFNQNKEPCHFWEDISKLVSIPQFWLGTLYFSATIGVYLAFSSLWNVPESLAYGHTLQTATLMSAILRFGTAIGSVLSGLIASYLSRCSIITRFYSTGALLVGLILTYGPLLPVSLVFILFFLLGFFFGGAALGFPLVGQYIPRALKGTGFGLMAAMGYLLCACLQYLTGVLLGYRVLPGAHPTTEAFEFALTPLILTLAIGWLSTLWIRDAGK